MKHTPGPWKFNVNGQLQAGKHGLHLGTFSESCGLGDAAEANKALIAAAPQMLSTLEYVWGRIPEHDGKSISQIKHAIAVARGATS